MAGYVRTTRWWRQAPPAYSELHDDIARQPRENCGADCPGGFLKGVIMREGMNAAEHCGNAMVFGGHRRARARAVQKCAGGDDHILRHTYCEAAQRINQLPETAEEKKRYILKVTCNKEDERGSSVVTEYRKRGRDLFYKGAVRSPLRNRGYKENSLCRARGSC